MRRRCFNQSKFNRKSLNSKYYSKEEESRGDRRRKGAKSKEEPQQTKKKENEEESSSDENTVERSEEKSEEKSVGKSVEKSEEYEPSAIEEESEEVTKQNKESYRPPQKSELFHYNKESSDEKREQPTCPICVEVLDETDRNFFPCDCGYQICLWCFNYIKDYMCNKCPACRRMYVEENFVYKGETEEKLIKKEKSAHTKKVDDDLKNAYDLYKHPNWIDVDPCEGVYHAVNNIRVVQRNLVFVLGITEQYANPNLLQSNEYFGKYGTILNVVANKSQNYNPAYKGPSYSAYITYNSEKEAVNAIYHIDGMVWDNKVLRASFGTTKYCSCLEDNEECTSEDCFFLHSIGNVDDSFTKDDILGPKLLYCELYKYYYNQYPENSDEIFEQYYLENRYSSDESYEQSSLESAEKDSEFDRTMEKRINEWKEEVRMKIERGELEYENGYEEYLEQMHSGSGSSYEEEEEEEEADEEEEEGTDGNDNANSEEGEEGKEKTEEDKKKKKKKRRRKKKTKVGEDGEEDESFDERDFYSDLYGEEMDAEEYNKYEREMFEKEYENQMMNECDEESYDIYDKDYEKKMYGEFYDPSVLDEEYDRREFALKYDPTLFDNKQKKETEKNGDGSKNECKYVSFYELLNQFEEREQEHSSSDDYMSESDFYYKKEDCAHHGKKEGRGNKRNGDEIKRNISHESEENLSAFDQNGIVENSSEPFKKAVKKSNERNKKEKKSNNGSEVVNGLNTNRGGESSKNESSDEPKKMNMRKDRKRKNHNNNKKKKDKKNGKERNRDSSGCKGLQKEKFNNHDNSSSDHPDEINKKKQNEKNGTKSEKKQEKKQRKTKNTESHGNAKENSKTKQNKIIQKEEEPAGFKSEELEEILKKSKNDSNKLKNMRKEESLSTDEDDMFTNDGYEFDNYNTNKENMSNDETYENNNEEKEKEFTQKEEEPCTMEYSYEDLTNEEYDMAVGDEYEEKMMYRNDENFELNDIKLKDGSITHSTEEVEDPYDAAYFDYCDHKEENEQKGNMLKTKLEQNMFYLLEDMVIREIDSFCFNANENSELKIYEDTCISKDTITLFTNLLAARWMYVNRKSLKLENNTVYVLKKKARENFTPIMAHNKDMDSKKKYLNSSPLRKVVQVGGEASDDDFCMHYRGDTLLEVQKEKGPNRYIMTKNNGIKCGSKVINMETYKKFKDYMNSLCTNSEEELTELDSFLRDTGAFIELLAVERNTFRNLQNYFDGMKHGAFQGSSAFPNIIKKIEQINKELKNLEAKS